MIYIIEQWYNLLRTTAITTTFYFPAEEESLCIRKDRCKCKLHGPQTHSDFHMEKTGAQNYNAINRLAIFRSLILQKKALRITTFNLKILITVLYLEKLVLKFKDSINLENILFISKFVNNLLPSLFNNWFVFYSDAQKYLMVF